MIVHGIYILVYLFTYREPDVSGVMKRERHGILKRLFLVNFFILFVLHDVKIQVLIVRGGGIEPRQGIHAPRKVDSEN